MSAGEPFLVLTPHQHLVFGADLEREFCRIMMSKPFIQTLTKRSNPMPTKQKRAQRKSISAEIDSLSSADQAGQRATRKDLVNKAKASRAKPKPKAKPKPRKKRDGTVFGVAELIKGKGRLE